MCSACQSSTASITPEALAAASVSPLPCETATERAFGRQTITTGTPVRSRPVTLAMRVMPMAGEQRPQARERLLRGAGAVRAGRVTLGRRSGAGSA